MTDLLALLAFPATGIVFLAWTLSRRVPHPYIRAGLWCSLFFFVGGGAAVLHGRWTEKSLCEVLEGSPAHEMGWRAGKLLPEIGALRKEGVFQWWEGIDSQREQEWLQGARISCAAPVLTHNPFIRLVNQNLEIRAGRRVESFLGQKVSRLSEVQALADSLGESDEGALRIYIPNPDSDTFQFVFTNLWTSQMEYRNFPLSRHTMLGIGGYGITMARTEIPDHQPGDTRLSRSELSIKVERPENTG